MSGRRRIVNFRPATRPIEPGCATILQAADASGKSARSGSCWQGGSPCPTVVTISIEHRARGLRPARPLVLACRWSSPAGLASAQGFFESLFGRRWSAVRSAYRRPIRTPFGAQPQEPRTETGGSVYCVRLCDGRFFPDPAPRRCDPGAGLQLVLPGEPDQDLPWQQHRPRGRAGRQALRRAEHRLRLSREDRRRAAPATARTRSGWSIRRSRNDPTLRPGDIVATKSGLMAYNGGASADANFTPIASYSGLSAELRRKLTETKITPAAGTRPAPPPARTSRDDRVRPRTARTSAFRPRGSRRPLPRARARR